MSWELAEIERLVANLIRVGVVSQLDEAEARVRVRVGGLTTDWLPWLTSRAGATRTWSAPTVGEQVLVLAPYGDTSQAVALPAIYQDDHAAPAASKDVEHVVFPDGSTVDYNSATNTMTITVAGAGNVVVNCKQATINAADAATVNTKVATIAASTSTTIDSPQTTCTGKLTVQGLLTYQGGLTGSGGGGASATIDGNVQITGDVSTTGALTNNGKDVGSGHTHSGVVPGGGNTGAPV